MAASGQYVTTALLGPAPSGSPAAPPRSPAVQRGSRRIQDCEAAPPAPQLLKHQASQLAGCSMPGWRPVLATPPHPLAAAPPNPNPTWHARTVHGTLTCPQQLAQLLDGCVVCLELCQLSLVWLARLGEHQGPSREGHVPVHLDVPLSLQVSVTEPQAAAGRRRRQREQSARQVRHAGGGRQAPVHHVASPPPPPGQALERGAPQQSAKATHFEICSRRVFAQRNSS